MSLEAAERIARALLYEGYLLYPYTPSSTKNRQRWTFGGVYPRSYVEKNPGADSSRMRTECLLEAGPEARIGIQVRFLHLIARARDASEGAPAGFDVWEEACEREVSVPELGAGQLLEAWHRQEFAFPGWRKTEEGTIRSQEPLVGRLEVSLHPVAGGIHRLGLTVDNATERDLESRGQALLHSLVSTHAILTVRHGRFISSIDPPPELRAAARECRNQGAWPVLVGNPGETGVMLSSPIILYDHPQIAPESPGDLFDSAEIDEILTLRILTLTDKEKAEIRATDSRGLALLDRTERLSPEELLKLHGRLRELEPRASLKPGDRVRIRPRKNSDVLDLALDGMTARIESVETTLENGLYLSVTLEDDPGRELGMMGQPGHRFSFRADEVEPL